ncbi:hypothetical protein [Pigmentiphaga sp.]|uniref:hypothetical protein n=1 Tax=Pigmentiphaga sp. TaxID=1977564 RepID=UPI00128D8442|nr:hypothetical protein [Pigmentiphaga sp.]MPS25542.1 hypothetical protein [Alcaligenaceae bacterium SAGV5]MPS54156.1 hypothetical protein [Alcaligenaceae bacterium SAGV3]MPT58855.1 hypothetical protein [Alcaligenaceae bacterium]
MKWRRVSMWVLWPAFLASAGAALVVFTLLDPRGLTLVGRPVEMSREAFYTVAFFLLWAIAGVSSAITLYLAGGGAGPDGSDVDDLP